MSVTVEDLMRLPSLRQAKVIGGSGGMRRVVSSISVLESTKPEILVNELFPDARSGYSGGELVITGFINCTDDVEMQCENVRRLIEGGEVGLVLYYVGVYLPRVDQRLIDMADENDFVLICMPEGKSNLRYGELITDVTECIYQDKSSASLVSDILDRMSSAPRSQQTVATALRMLCMELGCSIVLGSMDGVLLELATWPSELEDTVRKGLEPYLPFPFERGSVRCQFMPDAVAYCQTIRSDSGERYQLALVRVGMPLEKGELEQAADTLRICINIWGRQSETDAVNELVRAILQDEPLRMRRLAGIFHIDIASIHELWLFCCTDAGKVKKHMKEYCELMRQYADTVFGAVFEGMPVMCLSTPHSLRETEKVMVGMIADMRAVWPDAVIVRCCGLTDLGDAERTAGIPQEVADKALAVMRAMVEDSVDSMKVSNADADLILVGGGSVILPEDIPGASSVLKPEHFGCANAIGSAISKVSGTYEKLVDYDETPRDQALENARAAAVDAAVEAGAVRDTVEIIEMEDVPLAYYPGHTSRVKVKAAGDLR